MQPLSLLTSEALLYVAMTDAVKAAGTSLVDASCITCSIYTLTFSHYIPGVMFQKGGWKMGGRVEVNKLQH